MENIEKAIRILGNSHDGNDLTRLELKVIELAVNDRLSETGQQVLESLYKQYGDTRTC